MKMLVVTTSHDRFEGANPHPTGVWLEEFAVPYLEFLRNGVEMVVASPKGGPMPVDPRSLPTPEQEKAWQAAIDAAKKTVKLSEVKAEHFDGIFLPGGHGPMFDLPDNQDLQRLLREFYEAGKIISAVCHGPVGLVGVKLSDGTPLVKGKVLTSYTYSEEVAAKLDQDVPFILEHRLRELGANFISRENKADHVERDGQLITGQNPASSQSIARAVIAALQKQFPPFLNSTPDEIVPAQVFAEFPVNTFLENIAVAEDGELFVTSYEEGVVYRVTLQGESSVYAQVDGNVAGIALDRKGDLLVAGTRGKTPVIYRISNSGNVEVLATLPDAIFLNGMTHLTGDHYLIADSYKGAIWELNRASGSVQLWLQHDRLLNRDPFHPVPQFPGVNGIKLYEGALYASNTLRQQIIRIPFGKDFAPGEPEVFLSNINLDDFAFDRQGNFYGTTHIYNSVVRITPDRHVTVIAGAAEGVAGSTAVAFGRTVNDSQAIYVTTNGGMSLPLPQGVQPGRVVRLDVGAEGYASIHESII